MLLQIAGVLSLAGSLFGKGGPGAGAGGKTGIGKILGGIGNFFKPGGTATGLFGKGWLGRGLVAGGGAFMAYKQNIEAKKLYAQAQKLGAPLEDPEMRSLLLGVKRKERALETGVDPISALGRKMAAKGLATTQANIVRAGRGDPRVVMAGLTGATTDYYGGLSRLAATSYAGARGYAGLATQLVGKISARKFDIQQYEKIQKMREAMEAKRTASENISKAIGYLAPVGGRRTFTIS